MARLIKGHQGKRRLAAGYAAEAELSVPEAGPEAVDGARARAAVAGLPSDQAATVALDVPVGTVKTRLMHARTRLRAELERKANGQA